MLVTMQLSLPRDGRFVGMMRAVAECMFDGFDVPQETVEEVQVALTEACANAVRHAVDSAEYTVTVAVEHGSCTIEVADLGPGFDGVMPVDFEPFEDESGRGLLLLRALVDGLEFDAQGTGTSVTFHKRWPVPAGARN